MADSKRRLPRAERREQILAAATTVFTGSGFEATNLDDLAAAAGISRAILYRHFESKVELYRAVLVRARARLHAAVGEPPYSGRIIDDMLVAAAADPDGFRLLFRDAGREPRFREENVGFTADMIMLAHDQLSTAIPEPAWARWAAQLAPTVTVAAILDWLDVGQPDPEIAAARIRLVVRSITAAGNDPGGPPPGRPRPSR